MLLKPVEAYEHIYVTCGVTDMRKGIHGLACIVRETFGLDPFGNSLFLFCGRSRKFFKCLSWDKSGFELYYKRLDSRGALFKWPASPEEVRNINTAQLKQLMDGFSIDPPKGFEEVRERDFY